jgi:hypothetical protein
MADRTGFDQLPPEGAKLPRDVSRIVNQLMNGKSNNVGEFSRTGQEIADAGFVVIVDDIRVSEQSIILLQPLSVNAFLLPVVVLQQAKGRFAMAFSDPDDPYGYGQGQIAEPDPFDQDVLNGVWEQVVSPDFVEVPPSNLINVTHDGNGILTVEEAGTYSFSVGCSLGTIPFTNNQTLTFGIIVNNDPARVFGAEWTRQGNTAGIPMSFNGTVDIAAGETVAAAVTVDRNDTVEFNSVSLSINTIGVSITPPLAPGEDFTYRYLVVG